MKGVWYWDHPFTPTRPSPMSSVAFVSITLSPLPSCSLRLSKHWPAAGSRTHRFLFLPPSGCPGTGLRLAPGHTASSPSSPSQSVQALACGWLPDTPLPHILAAQAVRVVANLR